MQLAHLVSCSSLDSGTIPLPHYSCSLMHTRVTVVHSINFRWASLNFLADFFPPVLSIPVLAKIDIPSQHGTIVAFSFAVVARGRRRAQKCDSSARARTAARSCRCVPEPMAHNLRPQRYAAIGEEARVQKSIQPSSYLRLHFDVSLYLGVHPRFRIWRIDQWWIWRTCMGIHFHRLRFWIRRYYDGRNDFHGSNVGRTISLDLRVQSTSISEIP